MRDAPVSERPAPGTRGRVALTWVVVVLAGFCFVISLHALRPGVEEQPEHLVLLVLAYASILLLFLFVCGGEGCFS